MKKLLVFLMASLLAGVAMAAGQDVILRKDSNLPPIKAEVVQVGELNITYKNHKKSAELKEIPLYEVKGILYKDGTTQMIQMTEQEWKDIQMQKQVKMEQEKIEASLNEKMNLEEALITQIGPNYYIGGERVSRDFCVNSMKERCPIAYQQFVRGHKKMMAGYTVMGVGLGLGCVLAPILAGCAPYYHYNPEGLTYAGAFFGVVGGAMTLVGIPVICVNVAKRNDAFNVYNSSIVQKQVAELKVQKTEEGGLGIALQF